MAEEEVAPAAGEPAPVEEESTEKAIETARAQAEARRKRILEKANNRMQYVDGSGAQIEDEKKESVSKAARIRAARQRRYGKKTSTPAPESETAEPEQPKEAEEPKESAATTTTEAVEPQDKKEDPEITTAATEESAPEEETPKEPKKKYVGVARMRRKMLVKKKLEEETNSDTAGSTSESTTETKASVSVLSPPPMVKIPIYMHMVVIVLLFVAGFDVGVQQFHADVDVSHKVAVHEFGIPIVQRNPFHPLKAIETKDAKETLQEKLLSSSGDSGAAEKSEFDEEDVEYVPPNIDPVFRVDLDEYTKGPGVFNQMARGAISIHRLILWIFFYAPMGFFGSILSIPTTLMQSPPGLFAIAIFLRQFVGKAVLGASVPGDAGDEGGDGTKQNNIEVLSVAKNFVKNFFVQSFPTVVTVYDAYLHLKSDMYVVLCGVFLGLAWGHWHADDSTCEAATEPVVETGYGDEL